MAVGQQWGESALGGNLTSETFSRTFRMQAQRKYRWRQFVRMDLALGKNNGDYYTFRKGDDLADEGQTIGEFEPVPETQWESRSGQVQVKERTNANPYTSRLSLLSKLSIEDINVINLRNNMAKTLDKMCGKYFRKSEICYTPTGSSGSPTYSYVYNGNPTVASSRPFAYFDLKNIVDDARSRFIMPTWDNDGYIFVVSTTLARSLKDDTELTEVRKYAAPDQILAGELGKLYGDTRIIEEHHLLNGNMSNGCGEGVLIAWDAVVEAMAYAEEIQAATYDKWGRHKCLRWVTFVGWERVYNYSQDNGQDRTIRIAEDGMEITD